MEIDCTIGSDYFKCTAEAAELLPALRLWLAAQADLTPMERVDQLTNQLREGTDSLETAVSTRKGVLDARLQPSSGTGGTTAGSGGVGGDADQ